MRFIVSTCGTSVLTNELPDEERKRLNRVSNLRSAGLPDGERAWVEGHIAARRERLAGCEVEVARKLSAELNGILALYGGDLENVEPGDQHHLIATDTMQGEAAAGMVAAWLRCHGLAVHVEVQRDLQAADLDGFKAAVAELAEWAAKTLPDYSRAKYRVILNLAGGFKSVNGFMQSLGMLYADETVYLFEGQRELIRVPKLPIHLDHDKVVEENLPLVRRLLLGETVSPEVAAPLPGTLLFEVDGLVELSTWGRVLATESCHRIYEREVLDPPMTALKYGPSFLASCRRLEPGRTALVNERVDDLCRFVLSGRNSRRLDLKPLAGNPVPGSTHEIDAWADGDARRIFLHREGEVWVLDRLGPALH